MTITAMLACRDGWTVAGIASTGAISASEARRAFAAAGDWPALGRLPAFRAAAVADSRDDAIAAVERRLEEGIGSTPRPAEVAPVLLFTGQGSQYVGMGGGLYREHALFARLLDGWAAQLGDADGPPLGDVIFGAEADEAQLGQTYYTQRALFALEASLAELWQRAGLTPGAAIGHSIGELVAALVAGVLSPAGAARLVRTRSALIGALPPGGSMLAVKAGETPVRAYLEGESGVDIAAVNGTRSVVISGDDAAVERVRLRLEADATACQRLAVSHAFHSHHIDPIVEPFVQALGGLEFARPALPLASNVTGELAGDEVWGPRYWAAQARRTVRFSAGLDALAARGHSVFLEIGPSDVLASLARRSLGGAQRTFLSSLAPPLPERRCLAAAAARLFELGANLRWGTLLDGSVAAEPTGGHDG